MIAESAYSDHWDEIIESKHLLRRQMFFWTSLRSPLGSLSYWTGEVWRLIGRCLRPTGLIVCVLGPDGAGKSTVLDRVEPRLALAFRRAIRQHLYYAAARAGTGVPVTDPHGKPPYGIVLSAIKLAYLWGRYWMGYIVYGLPRKIRSTLILFDRYCHDLAVDPRRYRYGGPPALARLLGRLVPRPDLFLVLDAPPEVLRARKREVPLEEAERQRQAYLAFAASTPNAQVIDASQPIDDVIGAVDSAVLNLMAERTENRLRRSKMA